MDFYALPTRTAVFQDDTLKRTMTKTVTTTMKTTTTATTTTITTPKITVYVNKDYDISQKDDHNNDTATSSNNSVDH